MQRDELDQLGVLACRLFRSCRNERIVDWWESSRLVRHAGPTVLCSAKLGLRPDLDLALRAHGHCSVGSQHGDFLTMEVHGAHSIRESVGSQFRLVVDILPVASNRLLTTLTFARVSMTAAGLMTPYPAWVSFAGVLNEEYWRLNR